MHQLVLVGAPVLIFAIVVIAIDEFVTWRRDRKRTWGP